MDRPSLDPRYFQITVLCALLVYGLTSLSFEVTPPQVLVTFIVALFTQYAFSALLLRKTHKNFFEWKSAAISALSLCLLLRSNSLLIIALAALIAIGSKFLIRSSQKHIFNPTNLGITAVVLLTGSAWISPGQWGSEALLALLFVCCGFLVVSRAEVVDVSLGFLVFYSGMIFLRATYLGDPYSIPLHQLSSGALLLFTFFMISDPKTIPNTRSGRLLFALTVAALSYFLRFRWYIPNAFIYSLTFTSPLVPLIDRILRGSVYEWRPNRIEATAST